MMSQLRTYSELSRLQTYDDRFNYLKLDGVVGESTFGFERWLNQILYHDKDWRRIRNIVIARDCGHDLAMPGKDFEIVGAVYVHHMNPITADDIRDNREYVLNPELLICCSYSTHQGIHFGKDFLAKRSVVERTPYDTCPWKKEAR